MFSTTSSRAVSPSLLKNCPVPSLPFFSRLSPQHLASSSSHSSAAFFASAPRLFSSAAATTRSLRSSRVPSPVSPIKQAQQFGTSTVRCFSPTSAAMAVTTLNGAAEFKDAIEVSKTKTDSSPSTSKLVVIDFFAEWCGPCKAIAPKMAEYSEKYADVAAFYKINVDEFSEIAAEMRIRAMPTFVFFKDGVKVDEVLGAAPPTIEAAIRKHSGSG